MDSAGPSLNRNFHLSDWKKRPEPEPADTNRPHHVTSLVPQIFIIRDLHHQADLETEKRRHSVQTSLMLDAP